MTNKNKIRFLHIDGTVYHQFTSKSFLKFAKILGYTEAREDRVEVIHVGVNVLNLFLNL